MDPTPALLQLHADIDQRVHLIRAARAAWPCAKGCDHCCRKLAEVPRLSAAEWALLGAGLAALPADRLEAIRHRIAALAAAPLHPVVCPLLEHGACAVYAHRPVACRTYGFYVQRELGLYCGDIEAQVDSGALAEVVWGNHDAIDRELGHLGGSRTLTEWFAAWRRPA
jgi:Fe-S-cluster containining protein